MGKTAKTEPTAPAAAKAGGGDAAARVRRHRAKLKAAGLKPVTLWVTDLDAPGVREDIRRQCDAARNDPHEQEILREVEAATAAIDAWVWNDDRDESR